LLREEKLCVSGPEVSGGGKWLTFSKLPNLRPSGGLRKASLVRSTGKMYEGMLWRCWGWKVSHCCVLNCYIFVRVVPEEIKHYAR